MVQGMLSAARFADTVAAVCRTLSACVSCLVRLAGAAVLMIDRPFAHGAVAVSDVPQAPAGASTRHPYCRTRLARPAFVYRPGASTSRAIFTRKRRNFAPVATSPGDALSEHGTRRPVNFAGRAMWININTRRIRRSPYPFDLASYVLQSGLWDSRGPVAFRVRRANHIAGRIAARKMLDQSRVTWRTKPTGERSWRIRKTSSTSRTSPRALTRLPGRRTVYRHHGDNRHTGGTGHLPGR
jgi:hypothetical protein